MIMNKKTKLIVGCDSWGWTWYPCTNTGGFFQSQRHANLCGGHILQAGFPIMNVLYDAYGYDVSLAGWPGCDNFTIIRTIESHDSADVVMFMQTDPLRDICARVTNLEYTEDERAKIIGMPQWTVEKFEHEVFTMLEQIYRELCRVVSEKHPDCKLVAVGGNSALNTDSLVKAAEEFDCDLHILSYCLLDTLPKAMSPSANDEDIADSRHKKPVHPCFLFRVSIDNSWNPDLIQHLYDIVPRETINLDDPRRVLVSLNVESNSAYKSLTTKDFVGVTQPDLGHINAGGHIWLAEALNLYLESRGM